MKNTEDTGNTDSALYTELAANRSSMNLNRLFTNLKLVGNLFYLAVLLRLFATIFFTSS